MTGGRVTGGGGVGGSDGAGAGGTEFCCASRERRC